MCPAARLDKTSAIRLFRRPMLTGTVLARRPSSAKTAHWSPLEKPAYRHGWGVRSAPGGHVDDDPVVVAQRGHTSNGLIMLTQQIRSSIAEGDDSRHAIAEATPSR